MTPYSHSLSILEVAARRDRRDLDLDLDVDLEPSSANTLIRRRRLRFRPGCLQSQMTPSNALQQ